MTSEWQSRSEIGTERFVCGYCGQRVSSSLGYSHARKGNIYICPDCDLPTFYDGGKYYPGAPYGQEVKGLPEVVASTYREARGCMSVSAYTATALLCRKILMNIAHHHGAEEGLKFIQYVEYLAEHNYIPEGSKGWVDVIRAKGNEATHEISAIERADAEQLMDFTAILLRIMYEFPRAIPATAEGKE